MSIAIGNINALMPYVISNGDCRKSCINEQKDYGYNMTNPIMSFSVAGSDRYLQRLKAMDRKRFTWMRLGLHCARKIGGVENRLCARRFNLN